MNRTANIELVEVAAQMLEPLLPELVLLGGCATDLLITDPGAPPLRPTTDVDLIVEVGSLADYHELEKRVRNLGFTQSILPDDPICRWEYGHLKIDLMPTDPSILGFGNRWYYDALHHSVTATLPDGHEIRHVTAPYFVATKIDAFHDRGNGDYMISHDFEDIVAVLDGRLEIEGEILKGAANLRDLVANRFSHYLADEVFHHALPGLILEAGGSPARAQMVVDTMRRIVSRQES